MQDKIYDRSAVGNRIQEKRVRMKLTQEALAEKLGRSLRLVADIERGAVGMSIETLLCLCAVLKTTPDALLLGKNDGGAQDDLNWLSESLAALGARERQTALEILKAYLRCV